MTSPPTNDDDLISVVVPAWNAAATIGSTLKTVLAQTHRHIEVLVVDDGSRDDTPRIVRDFAARDARVRLVQQANAGVAAARNIGFSKARGGFLAPVDADDLWHPRKLGRQLQALRDAGSGTGVAYCWSVKVDPEGFACDTGASTATFTGDVYARLILSNFFGNASSPLIRKRCFDEVGGYDPGLRASGADGCEDLKFYLAIAERSAVTVVPEFLVGYRSTPGAMSRKIGVMLRAHDLVMRDIQRRHPELPKHLFRWARANFYAEIAGRAAADGRYWRALALAFAALGNDPFCPRLRRTGRNLVARIRRPISAAAFANDQRINLDRLAGCSDWPPLNAATLASPGGIAARRLAHLARLHILDHSPAESAAVS